jgi:hypothetical protein
MKFSDFLICSTSEWKPDFSDFRDKEKFIFKGDNYFLLAWNEYPDIKMSSESDVDHIIIGTPIKDSSGMLLSGHYIRIDFSQGNLILSCDSYETIPVYHNEKGSVFSTSLKTILNYLDIQPTPDPQGALETVLIGNAVKPDTEYLEIKQVCSRFTTFPSYFIYQPEAKLVERMPSTRGEFIDTVVSRLVDVYERIKSSLGESTVDFGLSGGMDSRLNLALIRKVDLSFNPHTLFKGANNTDSRIAHTIGSALNFKVREKKEDQLLTLNNRESYLQNAIEVHDFYGGRVLSLNSYLSQNYTYRKRNELRESHYWVLAGFGGEIFRNYRNIPSYETSFKMWFDHIIAFSTTLLIRDEIPHAFYINLQKKLETRLECSLEKMDKRKHYLYYTHVFLSDAVGVKLQTENKISNYIAPFLFPEVRSLSDIAVPFLGSDYSIQASLINELSEVLGKFQTNYGFAPSNIPLKTQMIMSLKSQTPFWIREKMIGKNLSQAKTKRFTEIIEFMPELNEGVSQLLIKLGLPPDPNSLLKISESGDTLLSLVINYNLYSK